MARVVPTVELNRALVYLPRRHVIIEPTNHYKLLGRKDTLQ